MMNFNRMNWFHGKPLCRALSIVFFLHLNSCATTSPRGLEAVREGMDKDTVLETAGNPKRTFREASQDHWIYIYFSHGRQWSRGVIFADGRVVKITAPLGKEEWVNELEQADSMEEYEHRARERQKKADNFKSIDGHADEAGDQK